MTFPVSMPTTRTTPAKLEAAARRARSPTPKPTKGAGRRGAASASAPAAPPSPFGASDLLNLVLMVGVVAPPALYVRHLLSTCGPGSSTSTAAAADGTADGTAAAWPLLWAVLRDPSAALRSPSAGEAAACRLYLAHPVAFVNALYFVAVDVGFYLVYLLQGSTWLIDPHWQVRDEAAAPLNGLFPRVWACGHCRTLHVPNKCPATRNTWQILPMCIALFYFAHPDASPAGGGVGSSDSGDSGGSGGSSGDIAGGGRGFGSGSGSGGGGGDGRRHPRAYLALGLVALWAARLLHNYFRREGWRVGRAEDWR